MNAFFRKLQVLRWPWLIGLVISVGLALRVYSAWMMRYSTSPDFGIAALAAKHMTEGRDYPTFFYGQAYMGNVEPAVTAILCRLFGLQPTAFMAHLGTALAGVLLLPLLYVFARDAGSRRAGLIAMLYCLVGSDTNFHYATAARCGYMTMMVAGLFTLWQAGGIATRLDKGERTPWRTYLVVGLAAGLGWWATQLVMVFFLAAGIILLTAFRPPLMRGLLPAGVGFALGGLPWWLWNIRHNWETFDFRASLGCVPLTTGLRRFWNQFLFVVELSPSSTWWDGVRLALLLGMGCLFMALLIRERQDKQDGDRFRYRLAAPVLLMAMALIYATSRYARIDASRYLLPMIPALAIMLGVSVDWLLKRFRWPLGWIAFVLLIPDQIYLLPHLPRNAIADRPHWQSAERLVEELGPLCDGVCLAPFTMNWMNFATGERLCFASPPKERYAPYARRVELAAHPAFLENFAGVRDFIAATRGESRQTVIQGITVDYDLKPPSNSWRYVESSAVFRAQDAEGRSWRDVLLDAKVDTCWFAAIEPQKPAQLIVDFNRPVAARGIRLVSPNDDYPHHLLIEGQAAEQEEWVSLLQTNTSRYFWSGPQVQLDGLQFFQEFRFEAPTGGVSRLRLTFSAPVDSYRISFSEVLFMEEAPPREGVIPSLDACLIALQANPVDRLYAPRWIEEGVVTATTRAIDVPIPSALTRSMQETPRSDSTRPLPIEFKGVTALLTDRPDSDRTRDVLRVAGLRWREVELGSFTLFVVAESDRVGVSEFAPLFWTEVGCLTARFSKPKAHALFLKAAEHAAKGDSLARLACLERAAQLYPSHHPARAALIEALRAGGKSEAAAAEAAILKRETVPETPAKIRFADGVEFLGLTLSSDEVVAGESVTATYYWKWPADETPGRPAVFVHWESGQARFQDDHVLLAFEWPDDLRYQPFQEVFKEQRRVQTPVTTPPGEYRLVMGLLDQNRDRRRLRARTDLKQHHRAVECPITLKVRAPPPTNLTAL